MKKKDLFVLFFLAVIIFLIICLLPEQVPIHFNSAGKADIVVNRFCLILGLPIPYSLYWKYFRSKSKRGQ
ncbi:DUF1648 domain-containing protein [Streptococcus gordonii]|jgi:hypothetical protein|uniref:DUF1648 domain-containing protein n=1 Tax=Streptococcus gordonii TaxID=1302 RepID=A0AAW3H8R8_STRGN|nr:DUF1648 domain-containing protein [Streptococcus gordonii]KJQ59436.1 hypothetical protein TZ86_01290 [Streptococcus gordonii]KJU96320.1 hypothetical protein UA00_01283 [Streptococcus gordonii]KTF20440.1 hypothetical protein AT460_06500 [Streptococcus gordonii]KXC04371.1 hypothetical protein AWH02_00840 [Streptococcus gordonii]MBZ2135508.1 DUF1648 domain-containing protein [Streptococcus gordonii]